MSKTYYEIVFEGHRRAVQGLLEGFRIAKNPSWKYYFSDDYGIKTETMMNMILEWISLKTKLHHVVMDEEFFNEFREALKKRGDDDFAGEKYIKSSYKIKTASFTFEARTYGKKYGYEIKAIVKNLSDTLKLHDYHPVERDDPDAKGAEMYAPEHDYIYEATGRVEGDIADLIEIREKMDDHPLIEVDKIVLEF